ncbi:MAG: hypothetical protein AAGM22_02910 [Acidobacteriota bacterium]
MSSKLPGGGSPQAPPSPNRRRFDALEAALRRAEPPTGAEAPSAEALGQLLIAGPSSAPGDAPCAAALLTADSWGPDGVLDRRPGTRLAVDFGDWPAAAGDRPLLPLLAWSYREEREDMEIVLAGLEAGRRLSALGVSILVGPTLLPSAWRGSPELTAATSAHVLDGLHAAGLTVIVDGFPAADGAEATADLRAYPHAFARGVDAVRLDTSDIEAAGSACRCLRDELGFLGAILGRAAEPKDAPGLLAVGCDLIQTVDPGASLEALREAFKALPPQRIRSALIRAAAGLADA